MAAVALAAWAGAAPATSLALQQIFSDPTATSFSLDSFGFLRRPGREPGAYWYARGQHQRGHPF